MMASTFKAPVGMQPECPSPDHLKQLRAVMMSLPADSRSQQSFIGKAGELLIAGHLLRRNYNTALLTVDTGIDLVAHKEIVLESMHHQAEYETYLFQIKTTAGNEYQASFSTKKFNEIWFRGINLIVVFWSDESLPAIIIIPPNLLRMLTSGGFEAPEAPLLPTKGRVNLRIFRKNRRFFIRNRWNEITSMLNRFDRLQSCTCDTGMFPHYATWGSGKTLIEFDDDEAE